MHIPRIVLYLALASVVIVWGLNSVAVKRAVSDIDPLGFTALRFLVMAPLTLVLAGVFRSSLRFARRDLSMLMACAACGYGINQYFWVLGLAHTSAFAASLLGTMSPLFVLVMLASFGYERIGSGRWLGAVTALLGVAIFEGAFNGRFHVRLGDGLTLVSAAIFAGYTIISSRLLDRYSPVSLLTITLLMGTLMLIPGGVYALVHHTSKNISAVDWWIFVYSVIFPIVLTYPIWSYGITRIGTARTALFHFLVPIVAGIASVFLLGARITNYEAIGAAVCICGMIGSQVLGELSLRTLWAQMALPSDH